jgi:ferredoxin
MSQRKLIAIRVDSSLCVGSTMCVSSHPDKFAMQADGHAKYTALLLDEDAGREAEELCPVSAISLVFEDKETP